MQSALKVAYIFHTNINAINIYTIYICFLLLAFYYNYISKKCNYCILFNFNKNKFNYILIF